MKPVLSKNKSRNTFISPRPVAKKPPNPYNFNFADMGPNGKYK